jgi:hypothetical protein
MAAWLMPAAVALLLAGSYADSFLHPTFFGDQGLRLDHADELVFAAGPRVWLPFLQAHINVLYRLHVPAGAFLLIPYAYAVASLFLLATLCRAAVSDPLTASFATVTMLVAYCGASFQWLGRSLYQESIVIPVFLALVYLFYFAPQRRAAFIALLAVGMLTREVFWIWWLAFLVLNWRGRLRNPPLRAAAVALGAIPLVWLAWTGQSPLLSRNVVALVEPVGGLGQRASTLGALLVSESLLPSVVLLAAVFSIVLAKRGLRGLSYRGYHVFSLVSLGAIYGYVLLLDPWQATPENTRVLVPLYAHLLVWAILAWRDASRLEGRIGMVALVVCAAGTLSLLKITAIVAVLGVTPPRTGAAWEPLRLPSGIEKREDWRSALERALAPTRESHASRLEVVFIDIPREEYLKFWVPAFLYDTRRQAGVDTSLPGADVVVAPADTEIPTLARRERLRLPGGIVRDVLVRER